MKLLVFLAFVFALIAIGLLVATMFTTGSELVFTSVSAGLALSAFIIIFVAYTNRSVK